MARKTFYLAREQRHPLYRTRMLQAGPIELDASAARLYQKLGVELSEEAPKRANAFKGTGGLQEALTGQSPTGPTGLAAALPELIAPKAAPAAKKAAPKRRRKK